MIIPSMTIRTIWISLLALVLCLQSAGAQPIPPGGVPVSAPPTQANMENAPRNLVTNPHTSVTLGDLNGWIWSRDPGKQSVWRKLIPGMLPQWAPDGEHFFYFLDLGFDGYRSEVWSALPNGENRMRRSNGDLWIDRTPIFSPDSRRLAWYYLTSEGSGAFDEIVVIDFSFPNQPAQVVYERNDSGIDPVSLRWNNPATLGVRINGTWNVIDATVSVGSQKP